MLTPCECEGNPPKGTWDLSQSPPVGGGVGGKRHRRVSQRSARERPETPAVAYRCQDAAAPDEGEQVEHRQLPGLVELAVLGLRKVQPPVHFLQFNQNREVRRGAAAAETPPRDLTVSLPHTWNLKVLK